MRWNDSSTSAAEGGEARTRVTLGFRGKLPRKLRRALSSRRWHKKACKALSAMWGSPIRIEKPRPGAIDMIERNSP